MGSVLFTALLVLVVPERFLLRSLDRGVSHELVGASGAVDGVLPTLTDLRDLLVAGRRRTAALVVQVVLGLVITVGRLHRGVRDATDVLASAVLTVTRLAVTCTDFVRRAG